jgi:hypothetical protein
VGKTAAAQGRSALRHQGIGNARGGGSICSGFGVAPRAVQQHIYATSAVQQWHVERCRKHLHKLCNGAARETSVQEHSSCCCQVCKQTLLVCWGCDLHGYLRDSSVAAYAPNSKGVNESMYCLLLLLLQCFVGVDLAPPRFYCVAAALLPLLRTAWNSSIRTRESD